MADYFVRIHGATKGEWKVDSPVDSGSKPSDRLRAGDTLTFYLDDSVAEKTVAHLQFTHARHRLCNPSHCFLKPLGELGVDLDQHWRSKIDKLGQADGVTLEVRDLVEPGEYHYAVFITPDDKFAFGSNPPPKIDVGGG